MPLIPGAFGPYRIIDSLGRGGMASVYKAYEAARAVPATEPARTARPAAPTTAQPASPTRVAASAAPSRHASAATERAAGPPTPAARPHWPLVLGGAALGSLAVGLGAWLVYGVLVSRRPIETRASVPPATLAAAPPSAATAAPVPTIVATAAPESTPTPHLAPAGPRPGEARTNSKDGLEYVWIPPGSFQMGCAPSDSECDSDEKPRHPVTLSRGFWLGRTEVTAAAYKRFASAMGRSMPSAPGFNSGWQDQDHPVVNVTWDHSFAFCEWSGGRLPSEAEWEYAARGGRGGLKYPWGDTLTHDEANYDGTSGKDRWERTGPTARFSPNGFGLFDMAGNVWEWVADWSGSYSAGAAFDPKGPSSGSARWLRGGSWGSYPRYLRVSDRYWSDPGNGLDTFGLRCSRDASP